MKSAENNCGEGLIRYALRPHTRHEKARILRSGYGLACRRSDRRSGRS